MEGVDAEAAALSLFDEYADKIYEFARYSLGNPEDAEDLVQDVFMRVYRAYGTADLDNPSAWIWTIARNLIRDTYRRRARRKDRPVPDMERLMPHARGSDTLVEVEDVLQQLSEFERQVVYLRLIEDLSVESTAKALQSTTVNVRVTTHRAIRKLRTLLSEDSQPTVISKQKGLTR